MESKALFGVDDACWATQSKTHSARATGSLGSATSHHVWVYVFMWITLSVIKWNSHPTSQNPNTRGPNPGRTSIHPPAAVDPPATKNFHFA